MFNDTKNINNVIDLRVNQCKIVYVVTTAAATAAAGAPFSVAVTADLHSTKFFCRKNTIVII